METVQKTLNHKSNNMEEMYAIKPGPKPKKDDGTDDRRRHVDPPTKKRHPTLPIHKPEPKKK
jgi:hypothetical protein